MPLYEFKCVECGHELEVLQKISAPQPTECPACKRHALQKKVTAAGFQLKGTGWYATDFKGGQGSTSSPSKPASAESTPSSSTETPAATTPSTTAAA